MKMRESRKEKILRLSNWHRNKYKTEYSFGVRLREQELDLWTHRWLQESLDEYIDDLGDEEDLFIETCERSIETKRIEDEDGRLTELRNRAEVDPMEQMKEWQTV